MPDITVKDQDRSGFSFNRDRVFNALPRFGMPTEFVGTWYNTKGAVVFGVVGENPISIEGMRHHPWQRTIIRSCIVVQTESFSITVRILPFDETGERGQLTGGSNKVFHQGKGHLVLDDFFEYPVTLKKGVDQVLTVIGTCHIEFTMLSGVDIMFDARSVLGKFEDRCPGAL